MCLNLRSTFCEVAPGQSAVLIKLRAGHNDTGPVPHRERNSALGVMGAPNGFLSSDEERTGQHCAEI